MGRNDDEPDPPTDDDDAADIPAHQGKGDPRIYVPHAFAWALPAAVAVVVAIITVIRRLLRRN